MTNEDCLRVLSPPLRHPISAAWVPRSSTRQLASAWGREASKYGPRSPHPAPWVFSPPGRCKAGAGGESSLRVICTSKAALPPTLRRPACARWLALIALSKAAPVLALLRFLGPTQPPPSPLLPMARNWCGGTGVLREDANQLSSVSELICIR